MQRRHRLHVALHFWQLRDLLAELVRELLRLGSPPELRSRRSRRLCLLGGGLRDVAEGTTRAITDAARARLIECRGGRAARRPSSDVERSSLQIGELLALWRTRIEQSAGLRLGITRIEIERDQLW